MIDRMLGPAGPDIPRLPEGVRVYAVGDVHGHLALLDELLAMIDSDIAAAAPADVVEVFLGDYVDRGPDSAGVIERLCQRAAHGDRTRVFLRGNHEIYMAEFLRDPAVLMQWLPNGAGPTLASYGVAVDDTRFDAERIRAAFRTAVPAHHVAFLDGLQWMHRMGDVLFAHAGIRPGVPPEEQSPEDLCLIRGEFLKHTRPLPVRVVHGHTPMRQPDVTPWRISIDTGAFATGRLTCAVIEGAEVGILSTRR
jgi:serine/threonine protein phosphatase 1